MVTQVLRFLDSTGKEWSTELEANFADVQHGNKAMIVDFVAQHFPTKKSARRGNAHASTAIKAITLWIASGNKIAEPVPPASDFTLS